jgi:hypothetical protein
MEDNASRATRFAISSFFWNGSMTLIASLILIVTVAILVVLWQLAADIRKILTQSVPDILAATRAQRCSQRPPLGSGIPNDHQHPHQGLGHPPIGLFVIWIWRHGQWSCQGVPHEVHSGLPPAYPGAFEGDLAKTWVSTGGK